MKIQFIETLIYKKAKQIKSIIRSQSDIYYKMEFGLDNQTTIDDFITNINNTIDNTNDMSLYQKRIVKNTVGYGLLPDDDRAIIQYHLPSTIEVMHEMCKPYWKILNFINNI